MRTVWLVLVLFVALGIVVLVMGGGASQAQQIVPPPPPPAPQALLTLQMRGAQRALNDTVKGVLLEHDPPKAWDLLIVGAKGKGQFTCELRSADKDLLFDLQRTILFAREITVNCANGMPSMRGGVTIDLDDPHGGSLVIGAQR